MSGVFYHSVIHGVDFFICLWYRGNVAKNNKTRFFHVLYSNKTWAFDQLERTQGHIYNCRLKLLNSAMHCTDIFYI